MRAFRLTITALLLLLPGIVHGQQIAVGKQEHAASLLDTTLRVFTYRPVACEPRLLLAVFHGSERDGGPYRDATRPLADKLCAIVVAPEFPRAQFSDSQYQLGGVSTRGALVAAGRRPVDLVSPLLAWARSAAGTPTLPATLLAHSGGAQFVSRVAAFATSGATRIVLASASTYVWPATDVAPPYGVGGIAPPSQADAMLRAYLALPLTILIGTADTGTFNLAVDQHAMAQGANRLERARNVFAAAEQTARQRGWPLGWRKLESEGVGHFKMFSTREALQALQ